MVIAKKNKKNSSDEQNLLPVLPLRDVVVLPNMVMPLFVGRKSSIEALDRAIKEHNDYIILVAQKDPDKESPKSSDLYKIGVKARILQVIKLQNNKNIKILVEGESKVKLSKFVTLADGSVNGYFSELEDDLMEKIADIKKAGRKSAQANDEISVLEASIRENFEEYARTNKKVGNEVISNLAQITDINSLCNIISIHLILPVEKKQILLEASSLRERLEKLLLFIKTEIEILKTRTRIDERVESQLKQQQKEYYLHEQMKAIQKELQGDDKDELKELQSNLDKLPLSAEAKSKVAESMRKLRSMPTSSVEYTLIRHFLDLIASLPWGKCVKTQTSLEKAQSILDEDHYGLDKVKERILEYLAVMLRTDAPRGQIICFVGPPGVGKTSLARSIAKALDRPFERIFLGGLRDEAELKGHRRTYVGAMPGRLIRAMQKAGALNAVMLLDEVDKISQDYRGDPSSILLELLDPQQNNEFSDNFLEIPFNFSKVMFIATANSISDIPRPLLDRMEIIRLSGYTELEKCQIARNHLIPKQLKENGLNAEEIDFDYELLLDIIRSYTKEAGVRDLERQIARSMRKSLKEIYISQEKIKKVTINKDNIKKYFGIPKYSFNAIDLEPQIGLVNALAYTEVGGDLLSIEVVLMSGKGEVKITGKLGEVMKESVMAAISYIRSKAREFGIKAAFFKEYDIHLHVPEGAVPKDGPSAGVAICMAVVSALTNIAVRHDVAMTGEITLRGRVLAIGGLKEKLLAAMRSGVKIVMIPEENVKDLEEIPEEILANLEIRPISLADQALEIALTRGFTPLTEQDEPKLDVAKGVIVDKIGGIVNEPMNIAALSSN